MSVGRIRRIVRNLRDGTVTSALRRFIRIFRPERKLLRFQIFCGRVVFRFAEEIIKQETQVEQKHPHRYKCGKLIVVVIGDVHRGEDQDERIAAGDRLGDFQFAQPLIDDLAPIQDVFVNVNERRKQKRRTVEKDDRIAKVSQAAEYDACVDDISRVRRKINDADEVIARFCALKNFFIVGLIL